MLNCLETLFISLINFSSALAILLANLSSTCCIFLSEFFPEFIFSAAFWYLLWALAISFAYWENVLSSFWSTFWVNLTDCSTFFSACFAALSAAFSALSAALSAAFSALSAALSALEFPEELDPELLSELDP